MFLLQTNTVVDAVVDTALVATETSEEVLQESINLWTMAQYGGWIMIILALLLAWAIYVFIERLVTLHNAMKEDKSFMDRIKDYIHDGKIDSAINLCRSIDTPASRMIEKGISRLGKPMSDILVAIENVGNIETNKLEKGFNILATIAGGAPMLGFLGTVIGMVQAFYDMANAGNNVDITVLSNGIYTAMITTVAGLIVGIIAYFGYNVLVSRLDQVVQKMETRTMEFMDLLNEPIN